MLLYMGPILDGKITSLFFNLGEFVLKDYGAVSRYDLISVTGLRASCNTTNK